MPFVNINGAVNVSLNFIPDESIRPFSASFAVNIIPLLPVVLMSISLPETFNIASAHKDAPVGTTTPCLAVNAPSMLVFPDTFISLKILLFLMELSLN